LRLLEDVANLSVLLEDNVYPCKKKTFYLKSRVKGRRRSRRRIRRR
jgi:hypothetical protein